MAGPSRKLPAAIVTRLVEIADVAAAHQRSFAILLGHALQDGWRRDIKQVRYSTIRPLMDEVVSSASSLHSVLARVQGSSQEASIVHAALSAELARMPQQWTAPQLPLLEVEHELRRVLAGTKEQSLGARELQKVLSGISDRMLRRPDNPFLPLHEFEKPIAQFLGAARAAKVSLKKRFPARGRPRGVRTRGSSPAAGLAFNAFVTSIDAAAYACGGKLTIYSSPSSADEYEGGLLDAVMLCRKYLPHGAWPQGNVGAALYNIIHPKAKRRAARFKGQIKPERR